MTGVQTCALPISYAEKEGTFTATDRRVQKVLPAIPAVGQSRTEFKVYGDLINLLGGQAPATVADAFGKIAAYAAIKYNELGEGGTFVATDLKPVQVVPVSIVPAVEAGKFALLTGAALYHCGTLSLYGEGTMSVCGEAYVEISRTDAAAKNIVDGDQVKVTSAQGSATLSARVSPRMPEGVAFAPYHFAAAPINTICSGASVTAVTISK